MSQKTSQSKKITKKSFLRKRNPMRMSDLMELCVSYDFSRVNMVLEAGEFSIRGGIIDIFSFCLI